MMKEKENFRTNTFPEFNEKYRLIIVNELTENKSNTVVIRGVISNSFEVNEFVNELKLLTNVECIYYYELKKCLFL